MSLVDERFWVTFRFERIRPEPVRRADGSITLAPAGAPRFDHDESGRRLGLLIEGGSGLANGDRLLIERNDDWHRAGPMTVLHALQVGGEVKRRAHYTLDPAATVDSCLALEGHHQLIGAVPGQLPNYDGTVHYAGQRWALASYLRDGEALLVTTTQRGALPLIAS